MKRLVFSVTFLIVSNSFSMHRITRIGIERPYVSRRAFSNTVDYYKKEYEQAERRIRCRLDRIIQLSRVVETYIKDLERHHQIIRMEQHGMWQSAVLNGNLNRAAEFHQRMRKDEAYYAVLEKDSLEKMHALIEKVRDRSEDGINKDEENDFTGSC